ncbi:PREDICTED: uncharacterized protein LOC108371503 [Rhagoletis zephyria]|uniref:uncharacterized protein LOC108360565 n=1 Tax=Rhagoletis zephyria TaxID=28612 RepID=UPI0008115265|nr:PREDICTED: uncharacterized protein LOC108360565 [Rhagoletis zephyria]XP_017482571.1 PREDICTED: uncharacterized protein LOC108371503 [Rhagoletis zephyria]
MPNQFPIKPPAQMPCAHWNHFPIHPQRQVTFSSSSGRCNGSNGPSSPPPSPSSYSYCSACDAMQKRHT